MQTLAVTIRRGNSKSKDSFMKQQVTRIQKAFINKEIPPKMKHVRAIILATFDEQSSQFFYTIALTFPILYNPITCWKFLYLVYKLCLHGHPQCIKDALDNLHVFHQVTLLPTRNTGECSYPIKKLANVLITRLCLYQEYTILPNKFEFGSKEQANLLRVSSDCLFRLSADLMTLLNEIISFGNLMLKDIETSLVSLYTDVGQCKMAPVVPCLLDAVAVYDLIVQLLFRLHETLGDSQLDGHRQRFTTIHQSFKLFFEQIAGVQYFRRIVTIPILPQDPPDFRVHSERARHKATKISVNELDESLPPTLKVSRSTTVPVPDAELLTTVPTAEVPIASNMVANLPVDSALTDRTILQGSDEDVLLALPNVNLQPETWVSSNSDQMNNHALCQLPPNNGTDDKQEFLMETELLKFEIDRLRHEHRAMERCLTDRIHTLEDEIKEAVQLQSARDEHCDRLQDQLRNSAEQVQSIDAKFAKLKDVYRQLRAEHVQLLRHKSTIERTLEDREQVNRTLRDQISHLESQLSQLALEHTTLQQTHQSSESLQDALNVAQMRISHFEREGELVESLKEDKSLLEQTVSDLRDQIQSLMAEKANLTDSMQQLQQHATQMRVSLDSSHERCIQLESRLRELPDITMTQFHRQLLSFACAHALRRANRAVHDMNEDELFIDFKSSPGLLKHYAQNALESLNSLAQLSATQPPEAMELALVVGDFVSYLGDTLMHNRATVGTVANLNNVTDPQQFGQDVIRLLQQLPEAHNDDTAATLVAAMIAKLSEFCQSIEHLQQLRISTNRSDEEKWTTLLQEEMIQVAQAVSAAERTFQELSAQSASLLSGKQLHVHQLIFDHCCHLMCAIGELIAKAKTIQLSLAAAPKQTASYKRHNRWNQGLISAAKSVGACANVLVEVANQVLSGMDDALERLMVISHEVSASTTQLFVASRVQVDLGSSLLSDLQFASKNVTKATGDLLGSVQSAIETRESADLDFSGLTLTQAKRMEVESQVRVLKLQTELDQERLRLTRLRKEHYHNNAEVEVVRDTSQ